MFSLGLTEAELRASPIHALIRGLRIRGDEVQLIQVVGALAETDDEFAAGFVEALLDHLGAAQEAPRSLACCVDWSLGRLGLRFEGDDCAFVVVSSRGIVEAMTPDGRVGGVRWAKLVPRLRRLGIREPDVAEQWQVLLDALETENARFSRDSGW